MKAVIYEKYGPPEVLRLTDITKPTPKSNEVLVKVHATSVTIGDTIMRSLRIPGPRVSRILARLYLGIFKPKRSMLGMELAGVIESVGKDVTKYSVGDVVFVSTFAHDFGGYAEYKCMPEDAVMALKPDNLSHEQASAVVGGGLTALHSLNRANIQPGQKVLIFGASGAVGTNAVQIANYYGADVTGVCSTNNLETVRTLGANKVIDYTQQDITQLDETYDVIFDAVGKLKATDAKKCLNKSGTYLNVHKASDGADSLENLLALKTLVESGALTPVIDRTYPLERIVEAHHYVDKGHKKGNVAITVVPAAQ